MKNWIELNDLEIRVIWDKVFKKFEFKTSRFGSFVAPSPFITFDISSVWGNIEHDNLYKDLEQNCLRVFQSLTKCDEYFYALDWQHDCYWVNGFLEFPRDELGRWIIPVLPDGEFYFFIQKDLKWGYLSHPWEETITIFGSELIEAFKKNKPLLFQSILRKG